MEYVKSLDIFLNAGLYNCKKRQNNNVDLIYKKAIPWNVKMYSKNIYVDMKLHHSMCTDLCIYKTKQPKNVLKA